MYSSLPTSGGIVGGGSFFGVHLSGLRFMPCNRSRELETGVGDPVAVGPATVPFWYLGTPRRSNWLASEFGDCAGELGGFHQGIDKLGMGRSHLGSEHAFGGGQSRYRGTTASSGLGNIGNFVNFILLVVVVSGLETSVGSGDLSFTLFEVDYYEVHLEVLPGLIGRRLPLPGLTLVKEESCFQKELEGNSDHFLVSIWSISCCCVLDGSFYLVE